MYKHKFYIHIAFHHYSGLNESHLPPSLAHLLECLVARGRTAREFLVGVGFFFKEVWFVRGVVSLMLGFEVSKDHAIPM